MGHGFYEVCLVIKTSNVQSLVCQFTRLNCVYKILHQNLLRHLCVLICIHLDNFPISRFTSKGQFEKILEFLTDNECVLMKHPSVTAYPSSCLLSVCGCDHSSLNGMFLSI